MIDAFRMLQSNLPEPAMNGQSVLVEVK